MQEGARSSGQELGQWEEPGAVGRNWDSGRSQASGEKLGHRAEARGSEQGPGSGQEPMLKTYVV